MPVMLAGKPNCTLESFLKNNNVRNYGFEEKRDGVRALLKWENGQVKLINRSDRDITRSYPQLVEGITAAMSILTTRGIQKVTLDGEIVCVVDGADNFREAVSLTSPHPKTYVAFDAIECEATGCCLNSNDAYELRRSLLWVLMNDLCTSGVLEKVELVWDVTGYMKDPTKEGVIAKHLRSRYVPGRSKEWLKFKRVESETFIVGGLEPGHGARADTFGALLLVDRDTMKYAGKVGSGFDAQDLQDILLRWNDFKSGKTLDPVLVEVEFDARSRADGGVLRFPVYKGIRSDLQEKY